MIGIVFNWHILAASKYSIIYCLCDIYTCVCDNEKKIWKKNYVLRIKRMATNGHVAWVIMLEKFLLFILRFVTLFIAINWNCMNGEMNGMNKINKWIVYSILLNLWILGKCHIENALFFWIDRITSWNNKSNFYMHSIFFYSLYFRHLVFFLHMKTLLNIT